MIEQITVEHVTFVSDRSFEAVIRAFEEQVGTLEEMGWPAIPAASRDQASLIPNTCAALPPRIATFCLSDRVVVAKTWSTGCSSHGIG